MRNYGPSEELEFSKKDQPSLSFHDFIVVSFEHFVIPKQIKIYETYNPGAVIRLFAYCELSKNWNLLWESISLAPVEKKAREFCPLIRNIIEPTR